jgi:hypothetical protein
MRIILIILFIAVQSCYIKLSAQCCAVVNPIGGTTSIGILQKNNLRFISFYRSGHSDTYFQGNIKSASGLLNQSFYHFSGFSSAYGITDKITFEYETGYFIRKQQDYNFEPSLSLHGYGFSNGITSLRINIINNSDKDFEFTSGFGLKFPYTKTPLKINNVEMPKDLQPSTGAYGGVLQVFLYKGFKKHALKLFLIQRFEYNTKNIKDYQVGSTLNSAFFITRPIRRDFTGIMQIRHEYRSSDVRNNQNVTSSGGNLVFISPQINYNYGLWNFSLLSDIPAYRHYNGIQFGSKGSVAVNVVKDIYFKKAVCSPE